MIKTQGGFCLYEDKPLPRQAMARLACKKISYRSADLVCRIHMSNVWLL